MIIGRILGWLFILLAGLVVLIAVWLVVAGFPLSDAAGRLWSQLSANSLIGLQGIIQRFIWAGLWDLVLVPLLRQPAWLALAIAFAVLAAIGWLLLWAFRRRRGAWR